VIHNATTVLHGNYCGHIWKLSRILRLRHILSSISGPSEILIPMTWRRDCWQPQWRGCAQTNKHHNHSRLSQFLFSLIK